MTKKMKNIKSKKMSTLGFDDGLGALANVPVKYLVPDREVDPHIEELLLYAVKAAGPKREASFYRSKAYTLLEKQKLLKANEDVASVLDGYELLKQLARDADARRKARLEEFTHSDGFLVAFKDATATEVKLAKDAIIAKHGDEWITDLMEEIKAGKEMMGAVDPIVLKKVEEVFELGNQIAQWFKKADAVYPRGKAAR
jgi:hypothetical protein